MTPFLNFSNGAGNDVVRVEKLSIIETGSYQTQFIRPIGLAQLDASANQAIDAATREGTNVTPQAFANVAGQLLSPLSQVDAQAVIPGGYQEKRCRFFMEVAIKRPNSAITVHQILTGFTDHMGLSLNGINEDMRFYINNVITTRETINAIGGHNHSQLQVVGCDQLLLPSYNPQQSGMNEFTMRPMDIMGAGTAGSLMLDTPIPVNDGRATFADGIKLSRRSNLVASNYLSRAVQAYIDAQSSTTDCDNLVSIGDAATGNLNEASVDSNDLFSLFSRVTGFNDQSSLGSITFRELLEIDPNARNVTKATILDQTARAKAPTPDQSQVFNGSNWEDVVQQSLLQGIVAVLSECCLRHMRLIGTNMTMEPTHDNWQLRIDYVGGFVPNRPVHYEAQVALQRILFQVLKPTSRNNLLGITFTIDVDLMGDTRINVGVNGGPSIPYIVPTVADGLSSMLLTTNYQNVTSMGHDLVMLASRIAPTETTMGQPGESLTGNNQWGF